MRSIDEIRDLVIDIKKFLIKRYDNRIKQVIIYGSFARGEAIEDSDIDVVVIVEDNLNTEALEAGLNDFLFNILLERNELISVFAIPESMFNTYKSPFILNTKEEGVVI